MAEQLFLGLDIGTSGVKAVLIAPSGDVRASTTTPLSLSTPQPGWAEQDPEAWWQAALTSIRAVRGTQQGGEIASVGISGQMHSSVFLDAKGDVIRPALLWCDGRTTNECAEITRSVGGEEKLREYASNPALEGFTLPKVLWLRKHEPQAFARLSCVMLPKDYIRFRLTGAIATEPSDASATLMYNTAARTWSDDIMRAVDLPMSILPALGESAAILGTVNTKAAGLTGLREGTPVVGGGADNACGAAGVGVVQPGEAVASWGTSGTIVAPMSQPLVDPKLRAHTFCHVMPQSWYMMGVVLSAGGAFAWYREQFARELVSFGNADIKLDEEAASVPIGADGVTFLPYLQGERTPHRDASARGAILGLSLAHTRAHITRAMLEGVAFALRDSLAILRDLGMTPRELLLTGGGAKSPFLRRLQADIFGAPVTTVNREEGPAYGAALLAAVGVGAFADLSSAVTTTLERSAPYAPSPEAHAAYDAPYARFRKAYHAAH